jgi:hypothetical protein
VKFNRLNNVFYKELKVHLAENNTVGFWHYLQPSARHQNQSPRPLMVSGVRELGNSIPSIHPNHFLRRYIVYLRVYNVLGHLRMNAFENETRIRRK